MNISRSLLAGTATALTLMTLPVANAAPADRDNDPGLTVKTPVTTTDLDEKADKKADDLRIALRGAAIDPRSSSAELAVRAPRISIEVTAAVTPDRIAVPQLTLFTPAPAPEPVPEPTQAPAPASSSVTGGGSSVEIPLSATGNAVVDAAMTRIGSPYVWGATGPNAFDCSGLVSWAYQQAGKSVPRTSQAQIAGGMAVPIDQLQPGDIVGYYSGVTHVAIYIGNGQVVHASTYGVPLGVADLHHAPIAGAARY